MTKVEQVLKRTQPDPVCTCGKTSEGICPRCGQNMGGKTMVTLRQDYPAGEEGIIVPLPWPRRFMIHVKVDVCWPFQITYKGHQYFFNRKETLRHGDGCPCGNYCLEGNSDIRIWLGLDGEIQED